MMTIDCFNTQNLRINANYEIEIHPEVYWIPVNHLGETRFTNDQIKALTALPPELKKDKITTLYEAIQLFQIGLFKGTYDNINVFDPNASIKWEFHKPGYQAVMSNEGCCATDSNWLSYLLYDKYEEMGFLTYHHISGGHIINYIRRNDWYYFIDMMMYRHDSIPFAGIETGMQEGYKSGELMMGNFHKAKSPMTFIQYVLHELKDKPIQFTMIKQHEIWAGGIDFHINKPFVDLTESDVDMNCFDILYPTQTHMVSLYTLPGSEIMVKPAVPPECDCYW
jgi:hypothetical protein